MPARVGSTGREEQNIPRTCEHSRNWPRSGIHQHNYQTRGVSRRLSCSRECTNLFPEMSLAVRVQAGPTVFVDLGRIGVAALTKLVNHGFRGVRGVRNVPPACFLAIKLLVPELLADTSIKRTFLLPVERNLKMVHDTVTVRNFAR